MPSPWTLGAAGLAILALLYYISWRYAARWVCRLLLKDSAVFSASIKGHTSSRSTQRNGTVKEIRGENTVNDVAGSQNQRISDSGTAQRLVCCTPRVVTDGVLAEISQL